MDFQVWTVITNSVLLTKVMSEHINVRVKVQKLHTYIQAYMIFTIIYPWFFVLSLIASHSLPIIITTVELCVCVCVCLHDLTLFSYSTTTLHFITWCQEWFSLRLASCTNFRDDVSAFMAWCHSTSGWTHRFTSYPQIYGIVLSCVKTQGLFQWAEGVGACTSP